MCGTAYVVSKTFTPTVVVNSDIRVPVITRSAPVAPRPVQERKSVGAVPVAKPVEAKDSVEIRFAELKVEGRYIRDALIKSEPLANQAYQNMDNDPQYRALVSRRHLLENSWGNASVAGRQSIVAEVNSIREATVGMVLTELANLKSAPAPASKVPTATSSTKPAASAPPPPPIIYM